MRKPNHFDIDVLSWKPKADLELLKTVIVKNWPNCRSVNMTLLRVRWSPSAIHVITPAFLRPKFEYPTLEYGQDGGSIYLRVFYELNAFLERRWQSIHQESKATV